MTKSNLKTNSKIIVGASIALAVTGCSSTHTEKWNEIDRGAELQEAKFKDAQSKVVPKDRPLTRIIDDFYVDTVPMAIIKEDKNSLPSVFHKKMVYFSEDAVKLNDLAGDIYKRTGLIIDFVNNEKVVVDSDGKAVASLTEDPIEEYVPPTGYFDQNQSVTQEEIIYEDEKPEETDNDIYIEHEGTLKELLDYVAVKKGLKWKYDQSSNKIFVYKYDTRTFTIVGFGEKIEKEASITTQMSSSAESSGGEGSSSTENEQSITIKSETNYWDSVKESVSSVISVKGSVTFNDVQGKIVVTDNDFVLSSISNLIKDLNKDAFREVALSVQVINISISDDRDVNASLNIQGINDKFNLNFGDAIDFINPAKNSISFTDGKTSAMLSMLDKIGKATIENSVDVITLNNMPVPIQLTQNRSYIKSLSTEENGDDGDETTEVEVGIVSEGITMTMTPKAVGQNILLDYSLNLSAIDSIEDAPGDVKIQLPITSTKNFVQRASLRNGIPRVIATVERQLTSNSSEHPMNENLWFLGGSEGINTKRDVLMVVVTPYVTDLTR